MEKDKEIVVAEIQREVDMQLADPKTLSTLIAVTFNGMKPEMVKQAMLEGMLRGYKLKDFLEKNIYAIPYGEKYSLVTSIDQQLKIAMRSGVSGIDKPVFEEDGEGNVIACSITVHRKLPSSDVIGDFTSTVYMAEYMKTYNGKPTGLWATKPRTMIAKVAKAHALRMACPEELSQSYIEEEFQKPEGEAATSRPPVDLAKHEADLKEANDLDELSFVWASLPPEAKANKDLFDLKQGLKKGFGGK